LSQSSPGRGGIKEALKDAFQEKKSAPSRLKYLLGDGFQRSVESEAGMFYLTHYVKYPEKLREVIVRWRCLRRRSPEEGNRVHKTVSNYLRRWKKQLLDPQKIRHPQRLDGASRRRDPSGLRNPVGELEKPHHAAGFFPHG
jgi:hypothetical protein